MKVARMLIMIGLAGGIANGQTVSLAGRVLDAQSRTPLKDVRVSLRANGATTTTASDGSFRISSTTAIPDRGSSPTADATLLPDGAIRLVVPIDASVSIRTFSTRGELLNSLDRFLAAGNYRIAIPLDRAATRFHQVRIGGMASKILRQSRYPLASIPQESSQAAGTLGAAREAAVQLLDTLVADLSGYATSRIPVATATADNLEILLTKTPAPAGGIRKARVIHTTDLQADPDDEQSLVHMFVNLNEVDLEGLVVATSCFRKTQTGTTYLDKFLDAYAQAYPNLKIHADGFPTPQALRSVVRLGQKGYSMGDVGVGKDSPGSDLIIAAVDKDDPRPVWVNSWGGSNTVAQALTKVKATRSTAEVDRFVSRLRVFDILGQDEAGAWIAKTFPNLLYIRATGVYGWQYSDTWIDANVQSKGPLGKVYPDRVWATEGDSPAFLHQLAIGLNDPDKIDQGGWGGRFDLSKKQDIASMSPVTGEGAYKPYFMHGNTSEGANAIKRWSDGYTNNFAARMLWSVAGNYADANHHPIAIVNGDKTRDVLYLTAKAGSDVVLDGAGSSDPDKNSLSWSWALYAEPSSEKSASISGGNTQRATVKAPSAGKSIHIVLTLKDNGSPALTSYRRVVVTGS